MAEGTEVEEEEGLTSLLRQVRSSTPSTSTVMTSTLSWMVSRMSTPQLSS